MSSNALQWLSLVVIIWLQSVSGTNTNFPAYSPELKELLSMSQVELKISARDYVQQEIMGMRILLRSKQNKREVSCKMQNTHARCLPSALYHQTVLMALFLRDELYMEEERRKALPLFGTDGTVFSYNIPHVKQILITGYISGEKEDTIKMHLEI
ncbi:PROTEIN NUCLEAR FUSION DEFECTIVE 4-LIKE [Salix purpurea]|uniref:PROTEIN NUCLEAR FUSION DEFECTIVE 4-LIKE n=1 Tax=Salix purpurea TaxID=77065 RepID=A0A9Q0VCN6_SALPP|nr:PROTEIN NUCLEAR FUSION DEFECTIVE 4-LIKE [Salix purpurea]